MASALSFCCSSWRIRARMTSSCWRVIGCPQYGHDSVSVDMAPSFSVPRRRRTRLLLTSARLPSAGILAQRGPLEWDAEGTTLEVLNFELIERCRRGESAAWTAFLPCFQEIGRRALRYFRLSASDCDDLLADVLTELYGGGLQKFRGNSVG